ncbi:MAG: hypothetical protein AAF640_03655 [Pseudomonadota bacterium]
MVLALSDDGAIAEAYLAASAPWEASSALWQLAFTSHAHFSVHPRRPTLRSASSW